MYDLANLFTWCSDADISSACDHLRSQYRAAVVSQIQSSLAEDAKAPSLCTSAHYVREKLGGISVDSFLRIVDAPETSFQVSMYRRGELASIISPLLQFLTAEILREGGAVPLHGPIWSCDGGLYFPSNHPDYVMVNNDSLGWIEDREKPFAAPTRYGIVLDYLSPYACRPLEQNNFRNPFGPPMRYSRLEQIPVTEKIVSALDGLNLVGSAPWTLVRSLVKTIMPRAESSYVLFNGGSNRQFMGRVNLHNPHLEYIDRCNVVNSIVHEAIHTFLYLIESRVLPVDDREYMYYKLVCSPWSGRDIHLLAYIHATCVWYGLYNFWNLPSVQDHFSGRVRDFYLDFSRKGFVGSEMLRRIESFSSHIHPELFDQLRAIQDRMSQT